MITGGATVNREEIVSMYAGLYSHKVKLIPRLQVDIAVGATDKEGILLILSVNFYFNRLLIIPF